MLDSEIGRECGAVALPMDEPTLLGFAAFFDIERVAFKQHCSSELSFSLHTNFESSFFFFQGVKLNTSIAFSLCLVQVHFCRVYPSLQQSEAGDASKGK